MVPYPGYGIILDTLRISLDKFNQTLYTEHVANE